MVAIVYCKPIYSYLGSSKVQQGHEKLDRSHRTISFCPLDQKLTGGAAGLLDLISGSRKAQFQHGTRDLRRALVYIEDSPARIASFDPKCLRQSLFPVGWRSDNDLGINSVIPSQTALGNEVWQQTPLREDYIPTSYKIGPVFLGKNAIYSGHASAGTCVTSQCVERPLQVPAGDLLFLSSIFPLRHYWSNLRVPQSLFTYAY